MEDERIVSIPAIVEVEVEVEVEIEVEEPSQWAVGQYNGSHQYHQAADSLVLASVRSTKKRQVD